LYDRNSSKYNRYQQQIDFDEYHPPYQYNKKRKRSHSIESDDELKEYDSENAQKSKRCKIDKKEKKEKNNDQEEYDGKNVEKMREYEKDKKDDDDEEEKRETKSKKESNKYKDITCDEEENKSNSVVWANELPSPTNSEKSPINDESDDDT